MKDLGYCGLYLDAEKTATDPPLESSLDIMSYCEGQVMKDFEALLFLVLPHPLVHLLKITSPQCCILYYRGWELPRKLSWMWLSASVKYTETMIYPCNWA